MRRVKYWTGEQTNIAQSTLKRCDIYLDPIASGGQWFQSGIVVYKNDVLSQRGVCSNIFKRLIMLGLNVTDSNSDYPCKIVYRHVSLCFSLQVYKSVQITFWKWTRTLHYELRLVHLKGLAQAKII